MRKEPGFWGCGIQHGASVKSLSLIPDRNGYLSIDVAPALYVNSLIGVLPITVDNRIRKGFTQSRLNLDFAPIHVSKVLNEPHELIDEGRDGRDSTWE